VVSLIDEDNHISEHVELNLGHKPSHKPWQNVLTLGIVECRRLMRMPAITRITRAGYFPFLVFGCGGLIRRSNAPAIPPVPCWRFPPGFGLGRSASASVTFGSVFFGMIALL
jgi:hypothetical protein